MGSFSLAMRLFLCVKEGEGEGGGDYAWGFDKHRGGIVHASVCACVCLRLHRLSVSSCMLTEREADRRVQQEEGMLC